MPARTRQDYEAAQAAGKTHLTYQQWLQVRTPEFKAWFGDWENDPQNASKVIHPETGEPLVVYHGTNSRMFEVFDIDKTGMSSGDGGFYGRGFYFSGAQTEAQSYGQNVISAFLNIRNPLRNGTEAAHEVLNEMGGFELSPMVYEPEKDRIYSGAIKSWLADELAGLNQNLGGWAKIRTNTTSNKAAWAAWEQQGGSFDFGGYDINDVQDIFATLDETGSNFYIPETEIREMINQSIPEKILKSNPLRKADINYSLDNGARGKEFTEAAQTMGYDGIFSSQADLTDAEIVAVNPNQIKSATANIGTFSPENPDIRYSNQSTETGQHGSEAELHQILTRALPKHTQHIQIATSQTATLPNGKPTPELAEGWYNPQTHQITLLADRINAGNAAFVAWHELGHRQIHVTGWREWQKAWAKARQNPTVDALARAIETRRRLAKQPVSKTEATEEAAAELYAAHKTRRYDVLEHKYGIDIPRSQRTGFTGYFARLQQKLTGIIHRSLGKETPKFTDGQVFELLNRLDRAKEVDFRQPEMQFSAKAAGVKFNLYEGEKTQFAKKIDDIYSGKIQYPNRNRWVNMGTTPDVLQMLGFPNVQVKINEDTIEKSFREQIRTDRRGHNIDPEMLKQLPEQMNNPVAVMRASTNADNPDSFLVLTELYETEFLSDWDRERGTKAKNMPVLAAFIMNKTPTGMEVINITTIHGRSRERIWGHFEESLKKDGLLYLHKEKGLQFLNISATTQPLSLRHLAQRIRSGANLGQHIKTNDDLTQWQSAQNPSETPKFSVSTQRSSNMNSSYPDPTIEEVRAALNHIDPSDREIWYRMASAVRDALGEAGKPVFEDWSRQDRKGFNQSSLNSTWNSYRAHQPVKAASLFWHARQNGWKPERTYTPPSPQEQAQRAAEAARAEAQAAADIAEMHAKAAQKARFIWSKSQAADPNHPYLQNKRITDPAALAAVRHNTYRKVNDLIVPVYRGTELVSIQRIRADGGKRLLSGGQKSGCYSLIGSQSEFARGVIITEGYATAASIREATGLPVIIAFDAGNLPNVAATLEKNLPAGISVWIAADNDPNRKGLDMAESAVRNGSRARILLPEFTTEQIEAYGRDHPGKVPTDFNDLHELGGIAAVRAQTEEAFRLSEQPPERLPENIEQPENNMMAAKIIQTEQERPMQPENSVNDDWQHVVADQQRLNNEKAAIRAERAPWNDFPPLVRNGTLNELKNHEHYQAAKAGDAKAALDLVQSLLNEQTVADIQKMADGREPIIVAVHAEEGVGRNKIPAMMAKALSMHTGWQVDTRLLQASYAGRTGKDSSYRLAFPPAFSGEVQKGRDYLIVDDNATMGGTIASLRGYIENRGGHVIGATVMSARATGLDIVPTQKQLDDIQRKHGDAPNDYWTNTFGYGIDCLTRGEAGAIRTSPTFDGIRNRIDDARLQRELRMGGRVSAPQPETPAPGTAESLNPNPNPPTADAPAASAVLHPQEQDMAPKNPPNTQVETPRPAAADNAAVSASAGGTAYMTPPPQDEPARSQTAAEPAEENSISYEPLQQEHTPAGQEQFFRQPENPQPAAPSRPAPAPQADTAKQPEPAAEAEPKLETVPPRKIITNLDYDIPAVIRERYLKTDTGRYVSADNGTTELFRDKGAKITTAAADAQTVSDMLEVAKAKGWDNIKLSGSREFKAMMYVAAESQGIRTTGYKPTEADRALLERAIEERSRNGIEAAARPEVTPTQTSAPAAARAAATEIGERIVAHGHAPYQNKLVNRDSYFVKLERNGRERTVWGVGLFDALQQAKADTGDRIDLHNLGKQPVTIKAPVKDADGKVIGFEEKVTERNVFRIDLVERHPDRLPENPPPVRDTAAQTVTAAAVVAATAQTAERQAEQADTRTPEPQPETPPPADRQPETPQAEPAQAACPVNPELESARAVYEEKAARLSPESKALLAFHERTAVDAYRILSPERQDKAMAAFYTMAAEKMSGRNIDLPRPIEQVTPEQAATDRERAMQQQMERPLRNSETPEPGQEQDSGIER